MCIFFFFIFRGKITFKSRIYRVKIVEEKIGFLVIVHFNV
jgi:hypothetical protein